MRKGQSIRVLLCGDELGQMPERRVRAARQSDLISTERPRQRGLLLRAAPTRTDAMRFRIAVLRFRVRGRLSNGDLEVAPHSEGRKQQYRTKLLDAGRTQQQRRPRPYLPRAPGRPA